MDAPGWNAMQKTIFAGVGRLPTTGPFFPLALARGTLQGFAMAEKVSHATVYFSGHVQGVGFRYATLQVARGFEVAGSVENLFDGRVCVDVEGEERELKAFVAELQRQLDSYVRETDDRWECRERQFCDFIIAPTRR